MDIEIHCQLELAPRQYFDHLEVINNEKDLKNVPQYGIFFFGMQFVFKAGANGSVDCKFS
jgi:hypothetical protein